MRPKLLESTVEQCRAYMDAGDCHGEAPPVERLIDAVVQLARDLGYYKPIAERYAERLLGAQPPAAEAASLTLSAQDAKFLAARLRRLFAQFNFPLPDGAKDDASLIEITGAAIGLMLTNTEQPVAWVNGEELRTKANATIACDAERRIVKGHAYDTPLYALASGVPTPPPAPQAVQHDWDELLRKVQATETLAEMRAVLQEKIDEINASNAGVPSGEVGNYG
jgi:hypothetical protein